MVIRTQTKSRQRGFVMSEIVMAMLIMLVAMFPLGFSVISDARLFRASYQKAVAMEIVDGEMEILMAGEWRNVPEGTHPITVNARAAANLPPGEFHLTRDGRHLRLEWVAAKKSGIGAVVREVTVK